MGSDFEITLVATDQADAEKGFEMAITEISRIEDLISSWKEDSQTSLINQNAGIQPVKVDEELFDLITRCIALSKITDGAFDISYASMDKIWDFKKGMKKLPSEKMIANSVERVGFEKIMVNSTEGTIYLPEMGMKIGFGAIGKGYAADKARDLLIQNGYLSGILNASGDMSVWGRKPNGEKWMVAIKNPLAKEKSFALLPIEDQAVVTSGNYEKFLEIEGHRYTHIIDPRTGYPAEGIISVTVFAPRAELADAMATAIFVMGTEVAINRVNQLKTIDCLIVDQNGKIHQSNGIELNVFE